jgi:hypothetical protein
MKMLSNAVPRRLLGPGSLAAVALMGTAVMTLSPTSDAHAEDGRRICDYSFKVRPENSTDMDTTVKISIGLDYKKKGDCPFVDAVRLAQTGYADWNQIYSNPVPKWTCEDWGKTHQTFFTDLGTDPCPTLTDDVLYAFFWYDPTLPFAKPPSYKVIANWRVYST